MSPEPVFRRPSAAGSLPRRVRFASAALVLVASGLVGASGCFALADGLPPPLDAFYYPTGLVVSPGGTALYVANSDVDLQYNGGTVFALDLVKLRADTGKLRQAIVDAAASSAGGDEAMRAACGTLGVGRNDNTTLYPGPCAPVVLAPYQQGGKAVTIGAFASDAVIAVKPNPCADGRGARLFVPVRGDPSVTYFNITDDREINCDGAPLPASSPCGATICLDCGVTTAGGRCARDFLVGRDPSDSQRGLTLPVEPFGIAVDDRSESIVVVHQTEQTASLVVNRWESEPVLEHYLTNLPPGPTDVASFPIPRFIEENRETVDYTPAFGVSFRSTAVFDVLRYNDDGGSSPARPFVTRNASVRIGTTASSTDSRGIAVDGSKRRACEEMCPTGAVRNGCLRACAEDNPLGIYMANRAPAALVIGQVETRFTEREGPNGPEVTGAFEEVTFHDSVPLAFGASRVKMGRIIGKDGLPAWRVFAVTYDSGIVFSYDPASRRVDNVIKTGRGPHALAFDTERVRDEAGNLVLDAEGKPIWYSTMYVAQFTDSYVGVVDLDMRNQATFGALYMTLGQPVPPKESQ
ncbi:hypothetical protein [Polyangium sorediatum]|uniref:Phytase-like domain-containing protein n=1 Tax=Polyangium sorediatum TaxID=889274 RepID=A0ABT6P0Q2_9BACT|nr:hypothetical protein [Polyangium sorediatum]MDI1434133.1 hypothetical protein [Polyangium sorediatum]